MEYFPGFTPIQILRKIQEDLEARQTNPEQLKGTFVFMLMFSDMDWTKRPKLLGPQANQDNKGSLQNANW